MKDFKKISGLTILLWFLFTNTLIVAGETYIKESIFDLTLKELMDVKVDVASTFYESELDVGSTVHSLTEKDWKKYGSKNLLQAVSHVPSFFPVPNIWGSAIPVRGYADNLSVRGLAHLVDGVPVNCLSDATSNYERLFYELGALDRIEIISGPGSPIYGNDAFHGVISMKTFERHSNYYSSEMQVGTDLYRSANFKVSQGITDRVRINSVGAITKQPDQDVEYEYTHPFTSAIEASERENSYTSGSGIFKVNADINKHTNGYLGLYYSRWEAKELPSAGRSFSSGLNILQDRDITGNDADFHMVKGGLDFALPINLKLSMETYYWESLFTRFFDRSRIPVNPNLVYNTKDDRKRGADITLKQNRNSLNTQWLFSCQYSKSWVKEDSSKGYAPVTGALLFNSTAVQEGFDRSMNSLVMQAKTSFFDDRFFLLYGGRTDRYSDFGTQTSPRLGMIYKPAQEKSFKFLYGQAFRAPTPNESLGSGLVKSNRDLDPETIDSYEFVYIRHTDKSRISLTLFQNEWENGIKVEPIDDPNHNLQYKNSGENESKGIEFTINTELNSFLLDFNCSYVDSEDTTSKVKYVAFPEYIFNIGIGYELHRVRFYLSNKIFTDAYVGPITNFDPDPERLPTYYRADLNIQWEKSDNMNLWLTVRNLTNKDNVLPSIWSVENGIEDEKINLFVGISYKI